LNENVNKKNYSKNKQSICKHGVGGRNKEFAVKLKYILSLYLMLSVVLLTEEWSEGKKS
jgi:hypothetical protein